MTTSKEEFFEAVERNKKEHPLYNNNVLCNLGCPRCPIMKGCPFPKSQYISTYPKTNEYIEVEMEEFKKLKFLESL